MEKKSVLSCRPTTPKKPSKKLTTKSQRNIVDDIILTDDASQDKTVKLSQELNIKTFVHTENRGYGGNQKTCYQAALESGADIVIMLHPDYQYNPKLIIPMTYMIAEGVFDSRDCIKDSWQQSYDGRNAAL